MSPTLLAVALTLSALGGPVRERAEALGKQAVSKGSDPRSAAALIRLWSLRDEVDDLQLILEPAAALSWRRSTEDNTRVLARTVLADIERTRGRTVRAQVIMDTLGFVQDWYLVGGFDNEGKGGCDTDFGPESGLDLKASYPARTREVTWRRSAGKPLDGSVDATNLVRPNDAVVLYALTFLEADNEGRALLGLGTSGGHRLWVNGSRVASSNRSNLPRVDQARVEVTLRKGLNRVLLKVCQTSGPLSFFFRAEASEGSRLHVKAALPEAIPSLERGPPPRPAAQPTLADVMAKRVASAPNDAALRGDYALVLAHTRAFDDSEQTPSDEATKAAAAAPTDADLQRLAAALSAQDANQRRVYLERALTLAPTSPWARAALARHELERDHPDAALDLTAALMKDTPDFAEGHLLHANALEALGQRVTAHGVREAAFGRFTFVPSVAREAVGTSRRLDRPAEAIQRARMALSLRFDDLDTRRLLASLLADLGKVEEAADHYRRVLELEPMDLQSLLRLAELLSANGQLAQAQAAFAEARVLAPEAPEVFEREGRALLHSDKKQAALSAFEESLAMRPQNPALREVVRTLRGDDAGGATPHAVPIEPRTAPTAPAGDEDALYLADVTSVRVQKNGVASRFSQLAVKVFTQRGVEAFRTIGISWSPDRQEVRVLKARITHPDGSIVESFVDQDRNVNEPWTGMYYDARARMLTFPALAPGDVLEVQWRVDDTAAENLLSDYWGDVDLVQGLHPKRRYRFVVDMPTSRPLTWNRATLPGWVKASSKVEGDRTLYTFAADDVARLVPEPNMPGLAEVATPLHLSTYAAWEDVGKFYWGLVKDQLKPDETLKKTVEEALKGINRTDTEKVVAALYGWVVTNTRYVALEFGIHGYKPYRVDRVLARRFGDCKDKASLIHSMLRVAGVESRLVLLRMRHLGTLAPEPASLSAFNHAIVYVPKLDRFLDGTAEFHGSRELPSADRVANVLIVEPEGPSRFLTTPEARPEDNTTGLTMKLTLKADGSAQAEGMMAVSGQGAPDSRRGYGTTATRTAVFEQQWAQSFPGVQAQSLTVSDVKALEAPLTVGFTMAVPRFAESGQGTLRFFPFGAGRTFTQALAPLAERKYDVVLPGVWVARFDLSYALPAGYALGAPPVDLVEDSPFGRFSSQVSVEDGLVKVRGELTLSAARIPAARYSEFRGWLLKVDQAFSRKLEVKKAGGQTARR